MQSGSHWNGFKNTFLPSAVTRTELQCTLPRLSLESNFEHPFFRSSWGESAGAVSIGLHLLINDGDPKGLFHGAFMVWPQSSAEKTRKQIHFPFFLQESGSPMSLPDITTKQSLFDQLMVDTGCTGSADLIACLCTIPLDTLMTAINKAPTILSFNSQDRWQASVDGYLIVRNPLTFVQKGLYVKVLFGSSPGDITLRVFSGRFQLLPAIVRMRERK